MGLILTVGPNEALIVSGSSMSKRKKKVVIGQRIIVNSELLKIIIFRVERENKFITNC